MRQPSLIKLERIFRMLRAAGYLISSQERWNTKKKDKGDRLCRATERIAENTKAFVKISTKVILT